MAAISRLTATSVRYRLPSIMREPLSKEEKLSRKRDNKMILD